MNWIALVADMRNFFASTGIATVFLDRELRIKKLPSVFPTELFNLIPRNRHRPYRCSDITARLSELARIAGADRKMQTRRERGGFLEVFKNEDSSWPRLPAALRIGQSEANLDGMVVDFQNHTLVEGARG